MTTFIGLLIGNETWELHKRSISSLRQMHKDATIIVYHSLDNPKTIQDTLLNLNAEEVNLGKPGLLATLENSKYANYNSLEFNIRTSFKWIAIRQAMEEKKDNIVFVDSDISIISPLPIDIFKLIWEEYDIFVQDEGNSAFPKHPCTGFMGFRFCDENLELLDTLHKDHCSTLVSKTSLHDQTVFFNCIAKNTDLLKRTYFLPQMLFPVGYLGPIYKNFSNDRIKFRGQPNPYIYHANWAVGIEAKAALMDSFQQVNIGNLQPSPNKPLEIEYRVGKYTLKLPGDHLLPYYQKKHPRYDRFLPHLVPFLKEDSYVIDVGANCGDSLAGMASKSPNLHYVCIEADSEFYDYLKVNLQRLKSQTPNIDVHIFCSFIGDNVSDVILKGQGGTKTAIIDNDFNAGLKSIRLDLLIEPCIPRSSRISLIKTDTDGWDYDVLSSSSGLISSHKPLIFFECQYSNNDQLQGYQELAAELEANGYTHWFIFDNFGEFILHTTSLTNLIELMSYVERQNKRISTRTFYYLDILATTESDYSVAQEAISSYTRI